MLVNLNSSIPNANQLISTAAVITYNTNTKRIIKYVLKNKIVIKYTSVEIPPKNNCKYIICEKS